MAYRPNEGDRRRFWVAQAFEACGYGAKMEGFSRRGTSEAKAVESGITLIAALEALRDPKTKILKAPSVIDLVQLTCTSVAACYSPASMRERGSR
jgi:hypothetical protein